MPGHSAQRMPKMAARSSPSICPYGQNLCIRIPVTGQDQRVFVVDDEASVRRALKRLLSSADYAVETFASAQQYLKRDIFEGHSCLVLDVRMPGLNGFALQDRLAALGRHEQIV